jgi:HAE1 family hydrophobic/amphiphilic exporter-1
VNVSEIFIRRPIATSLLMAGIAFFGVLAYSGLSVSDLPNVDFPTITVSAGLPGGDPNIMSSAVASPLERQFTTIAGLDSMTSRSSMGGTSITLQFALDRDIDSAAVDVQTAIAAVMPLLPPGMPAPPSFRKFNPADDPLMMLWLTSSTVPMSMLNDYAETLVAPRISMVNGVAQVAIQGAQKYAVRVQVDPSKLRAQQIGINEIDTALQNWNVNLPTGQLYGAGSTFNIKASGQLMDAAAFRRLVLGYRHGAPVHLDQVATVLDSVEDNRTSSWIDTPELGRPRAIGLQVNRQPGSNIIDVTDTIKSLLPAFEAQLPPSVHLTLLRERAKSIRAAFKDIQGTMVLTLFLVVGVIFIFLRNGSATLIPALALPFSILGTFAVMHLLHYTLDSLSMMALILSIGFIVDDAIVMLENIVRHIEHGEAPLEAALRGSREIGFTILSMTISLAAVFIPILFMAGVLGRLFREFAVTIMTAILISGIVSVTLTPMLCSRFLRAPNHAAQSRLSAWCDRAFDWLLAAYERSLRLVLRHRPVMLAISAGVLVATVLMARIVPRGFIPDQDIDLLNVSVRAAQGTAFTDTQEYAKQVAGILRKNPLVRTFMMSSGGGGQGAMNTANFSVQVTPRGERALSIVQVAQQLRGQTSRLPGAQVFVTIPPVIQIGGRGSNSTYQFTLQSLEPDDLYLWAERLEQAIATLSNVQDVNDDMQRKNPVINLKIDRDRAASLRLDAAQLENALYSGYGPRWSSTIYGPTNQYRVLLELDPREQLHADSLRTIGFKTPAGALVPLESVVSFQESVGPLTVNHSGQLASVTISFALRPGVALGDAVESINGVAARVLPPTVTARFDGTAKVFEDSSKNLGLLLFVAIGVVYIVLGMLYESYIHPITILSGLPAAGLGALVILWATGNELNIYSFVGLIMLVGIVKKNAIMQIDFALDAERRHGKPPAEAICEGCVIRFRPIMMTTMAALFGAIPVALSSGVGSEGRRPLGLAVVGGLIVSQLITLYLTPVVYTYLAELFRARSVATVAATAPA